MEVVSPLSYSFRIALNVWSYNPSQPTALLWLRPLIAVVSSSIVMNGSFCEWYFAVCTALNDNIVLAGQYSSFTISISPFSRDMLSSSVLNPVTIFTEGCILLTAFTTLKKLLGLVLWSSSIYRSS